MKKNLAKRMVVAAILTSWLVTPASVFADQRVELTGGNAETQTGISNSNYTGNFGGAVYNEGTNKTLSGEFSNNSSQVSGGALENWEGAGVTVSNGSTFVNNEIITHDLQQSYGGAINNKGQMTIENGTESNHVSFSGNKAGQGGAIYNYATGIPTYIGNYTSFDNNTSQRGYGSAIYTRSGMEIGDNVSFTNNTANWGGALASEMVGTASMPDPSLTTITIGKNVLFQNNIADWTKTSWAMGGAIVNTNGTIEIGDGARFISNKAANGGAIANKKDNAAGPDSVISLGKSYFEGNQAMNGLGGAIFNAAEINVGTGSAFVRNSSTGNGGAIYNAGNLTISGDLSQEYNTNFDNNHSDGNGGAIFNAGIADIKDGVTFTNNSATGNGGAIYAEKGSTTTIGNDVKFVGNYTNNQYGYGGAIYVNDAVLSIGDNVLFQNNHSSSTDEWGGAGGGAIAKWGLQLATIGDGSKFIHNGYGSNGSTDTKNGGAIYHSGAVGAWIYDPATGNENLTVTGAGGKLVIGDNASFQNNASELRGGALYNENGIVEIGQGSVFFENSSKNGGAIYNVKTYEDTPAITVDTSVTLEKGSQFVNNNVTGLGGAIYNYRGDVTVKGGDVTIGTDTYTTVFSGNTAGSNGGAIYNAGNLIMDTSDGDISFINNSAGGIANDIYMAADSTFTLNGSGEVSIGSGISSESVSNAVIVNNGANLVLEQGSKNAGYLGNYTQNSGTTDVNTEFFGGKSTISGGSLNLNDKANIVAGSSVVLGAGGSININGNGTPDEVQNSNVVINGAIESAAGNGSITLSGGNLVINGDQRNYKGDFIQNGDLNTTTTVSSTGIFFGGNNEINAGKLVIKKGGSLASDITINDYSVALDLDGRDFLLSNSGIEITGDAGTHSIKGSLNLENTNVQVDQTTGIQSDLYIANGSTISNVTIPGVEPDKTVVVGDASHNVTLSLGSGASTGSQQILRVSDGSEINLTPRDNAGGLHLNAAIESATEGTGTVKVEGTEISGITYNVGNILISSDNSNFTGNYIQNDGTVTLDKGAVFFGGTNNVNTDTTAGTSGSLILNDGALLANDVNINGNSSSSIFELASVAFNGDAGEVTQSNITSGEFSYAGIDGASNSGVNVNNASAVFQNNTIIKELDTAQNALVLNTNMAEDKGVRFLGFGQGSGVEGNIILESGTGVGYLDGAYIKDNSTLTMNNADLVFGNDKTNIHYNPIIVGNGNISMVGNGMTSISSALNRDINILAESGVLNLNNASTDGLGNVFVGDYENTTGSGYDKSGAVVNVLANKATVGEIKVYGENARLNFNGDITGTNATVKEGTLGIYGQSSLSSLSLGSTLDMLGNNRINNLDVTNFTLTDNSKYMFDVDPRTRATDTINASNIINANADPAGDPYQMLIAGINFTRSPIDRNVQFDITNMISENGDSRADLINMPEGGVISNSAMGQYLITSSGAGSPILNASLLALNPQMYRGQVSTIASWQNQLVVNNMLFDHMDVLTRQLMNEQKTANKYAAAYPQFAPYQYDLKGGSLWYKAYGNFERLSMTKGLSVGNNAYGSLIGADFPLINLKNGWKLVPTAYIGYNGAHQTYDGVSMYQNGAQIGFMGTAYKGDFITSLLAYGGGYANDMSVHGQFGGGSDTTGNWFAGVASKSAYNIRLPHDFIFQPTAMVAYNAFGSQNWGSSFGAMSMSSGMLNGLNAAPGFNLIWQKKTFSLYATAQMVYNVMGQVDGRAGNVDLGYVRMRHSYFEYGLGAMKTFKDRFTGYLQITFRNGGRTGVGFQGGLQWKIGKE